MRVVTGGRLAARLRGTCGRKCKTGGSRGTSVFPVEVLVWRGTSSLAKARPSIQG